MPAPYSLDLSERIVHAVEQGLSSSEVARRVPDSRVSVGSEEPDGMSVVVDTVDSASVFISVTPELLRRIEPCEWILSVRTS